MKTGQLNILWNGRTYSSMENCLVTIGSAGVMVSSVIIGRYDKILFRVEYEIHTDQAWRTSSFAVRAQYANKKEHFNFERNERDQWFRNGVAKPEFNNCTDVDIALTPFTNTLPINRLRIEPGSESLIDVVYVDLMNGKIKPVKQKYTRLVGSRYKYENVPNDFEAFIEVDEIGFVKDYPPLFSRLDCVVSSYPE